MDLPSTGPSESTSGAPPLRIPGGASLICGCSPLTMIRHHSQKVVHVACGMRGLSACSRDRTANTRRPGTGLKRHLASDADLPELVNHTMSEDGHPPPADPHCRMSRFGNHHKAVMHGYQWSGCSRCVPSSPLSSTTTGASNWNSVGFTIPTVDSDTSIWPALAAAATRAAFATVSPT